MYSAPVTVQGGDAKRFRQMFAEGRLVDVMMAFYETVAPQVAAEGGKVDRSDFGFAMPTSEVAKLSPEEQWRSFDSPTTVCSLVWLMTDDPIAVCESSRAGILALHRFSADVDPGAEVWNSGLDVVRQVYILGREATDEQYTRLGKADQEIDEFVRSLALDGKLESKDPDDLTRAALVMTTNAYSTALRDVLYLQRTGNRSYAQRFIENVAKANQWACMAATPHRYMVPGEPTEEMIRGRVQVWSKAARAAAIATPLKYIQWVIQNPTAKMVPGGSA